MIIATVANSVSTNYVRQVLRETGLSKLASMVFCGRFRLRIRLERPGSPDARGGSGIQAPREGFGTQLACLSGVTSL